jgi:hypothetical protein
MKTSPDAEMSELEGAGTDASETLSRLLLTLAKNGKPKPTGNSCFSLRGVLGSEFGT